MFLAVSVNFLDDMRYHFFLSILLFGCLGIALGCSSNKDTLEPRGELGCVQGGACFTLGEHAVSRAPAHRPGGPERIQWKGDLLE